MSHSVCRGEKRTEAPEEEDGGFSFPEYYSWRASRHKEKKRKKKEGKYTVPRMYGTYYT